VLVVGTKIGPHSTAKGAEKSIVRFSVIETVEGCVIGDDFGGKSIDQIDSCGKSFIPEF
jgi:hypothetical protein